MCVHSIYLKQINVRVGTCKCIAAWCVQDDRSLSRTTELAKRDPHTYVSPWIVDGERSRNSATVLNKFIDNIMTVKVT